MRAVSDSLRGVIVNGEWITRSILLYTGVLLLRGIVPRPAVMSAVYLHCLARMATGFFEGKSILSLGATCFGIIALCSEMTSTATALQADQGAPHGLALLLSSPLLTLFATSIAYNDLSEAAAATKNQPLLTRLGRLSSPMWLALFLTSLVFHSVGVLQSLCWVTCPALLDPAVWLARGVVSLQGQATARRASCSSSSSNSNSSDEGGPSGEGVPPSPGSQMSPTSAKLKARLSAAAGGPRKKKKPISFDLHVDRLQYYIFVLMCASRLFPELLLLFAITEDLNYVLYSDMYAIRAHLCKVPTRSCVKKEKDKSDARQPSFASTVSDPGDAPPPLSPDDSSVGPPVSDTDSPSPTSAEASLLPPGGAFQGGEAVCGGGGVRRGSGGGGQRRGVVFVDERGGTCYPSDPVCEQERETLQGFPKLTNVVQTGLRKPVKRLSMSQLMSRQTRRLSKMSRVGSRDH